MTYILRKDLYIDAISSEIINISREIERCAKDWVKANYNMIILLPLCLK